MRPRVAKLVFTGAVTLSVFAALIVGTRTELFAKAVEALWTRNVDEPGRAPREMQARFNPAFPSGCEGDCLNFTVTANRAEYDLPAIPAGKRWVVRQATGAFAFGYGQNLELRLTSPGAAGSQDRLKWAYAGPYFPGNTSGPTAATAVFSTELFVTFGPGETPHVTLFGEVIGPVLPLGSTIVFSGYLIDADVE